MRNGTVLAIIAMLRMVCVSPGADYVRAGDCCSACQCNCRCTKVCRLVREEKKVEVVCWGCLCEEFCLPGPSRPGCEHCETVCSSCEDKTATDAAKEVGKATDPKKTPSTRPKKFVWTSWIPGSADIASKKKLMKKTVVKKIPSYKWVVEDLCPECQAKAQSAPIEADAKIPAPPKTDAKIIESPAPRQ